jgi:predicted lactoylglutathione lyase
VANRETGIWINLAVQDLERSRSFFSVLGFGFNPKFTDAKAACLVLNERAFVMLLKEEFFGGFTKRQMCNTATHTETMLAIECGSREEVDILVKLALTAGGTPCMDPVDHGFMYAWSFYDLDGHHWEAFWMAEGGPE